MENAENSELDRFCRATGTVLVALSIISFCCFVGTTLDALVARGVYPSVWQVFHN